MWSSVLVMGLLGALTPVRLGVTLLVISRPRPMQNLLAYWVGCLIVGVPCLLVPLIMLHVTPILRSFPQRFANPDANSTVRHIQFGMGVFALSIAALIAVPFFARKRAHLPAPGGNTSSLALDSNKPTAISRLLGHRQDAATEGGSTIRRLLGRAYNAWESGSLWVALVIGLGSPPAIDGSLFVVAIIVTSGAAIGTQVSAAIAFVVAMLAVAEAILASNLVAPAKAQAVVQRLHDWAWAHTRHVLVAMFTLAGVSLVAMSMGLG